MTLDALIMGTGGLIVVLPFLGLPDGWDTVLFFLAGILVIALGIMVRRRGMLPHPNLRATPPRDHSFVESNPTSSMEHEE
jgi:hypothetical protein